MRSRSRTGSDSVKFGRERLWGSCERVSVELEHRFADSALTSPCETRWPESTSLVLRFDIGARAKHCRNQAPGSFVRHSRISVQVPRTKRPSFGSRKPGASDEYNVQAWRRPDHGTSTHYRVDIKSSKDVVPCLFDNFCNRVFVCASVAKNHRDRRHLVRSVCIHQGAHPPSAGDVVSRKNKSRNNWGIDHGVSKSWPGKQRIVAHSCLLKGGWHQKVREP